MSLRLDRRKPIFSGSRVSASVVAMRALATLGFVSGLVVLAASPLLLLWLDRALKIDWNRLGDIGQTYGAASALLSGLAVGGVAVSMALQVRQTRISQIQAQRMTQLEVMRILLSDPSLRVMSPESAREDILQWKTHIVTNLIFMSLQMSYEIGYLSRRALHGNLAARFQRPTTREFWRQARRAYEVDATSSARRQFYLVAEEEYGRAMAQATGVGESSPTPVENSDRRRVAWRCGLGVAAGLFVGYLSARAVRGRNN